MLIVNVYEEIVIRQGQLECVLIYLVFLIFYIIIEIVLYYVG